MLTYHWHNFSFYMSKSILDLATCDTNMTSRNGACDGQLTVLSSELHFWCMHVCTHDFQAVTTFNTDDDVCFRVSRGFWLQTLIICCLLLTWELTSPPTAHSPFTSISPEHLFTHTANRNLEIMHFYVFHFSSYATELTFFFELTEANAALYLGRNVY